MNPKDEAATLTPMEATLSDSGLLLRQDQSMLAALEAIETGTPHDGEGTGSPVSLPEQLAAALTQALSRFTVRLDGRAVGSLVAPTVSECIAQKTALRRYTV